MFDLDGVIVDTEVQWKKMWLDFLNAKNFPFTEADYGNFPGGNWHIFYRELSNMFPNFYGSYQEMIDNYFEYFADYKIDYHALAMPYLKEVLVELKRRDYVIVIASSSGYKHINEVLEELAITKYFDFVVSGYDFKESKPHPEIYLFTAEKLQEKPENCYVVEDSTYGIQSAVAAGMKVIGLKDERFGYDQSLADYLIDDLKGILEVVE